MAFRKQVLRRRQTVGLLAAATAVGLLLLPSPALATPAPDSGPTSGGTTVSDTIPEVTFTQVSDGGSLILALGTDGNAYSYGFNIYGAAGNGTSNNTSSTLSPVTMPSGVTFTQVSTDTLSSYAVGSDGNAYAWGQNNAGQLGDGTTTDQLTPVPVLAPAGVHFTQISSSYFGGSGVNGGGPATFAIGSDGKIYAWGSNLNGQLGDGTTTDRHTPVQVLTPAGVSFTHVETSGAVTLALGSDGNAYGWGAGDNGAVGDGTYTRRLTPVKVAAPAGVSFSAIAFSSSFAALAIGTDGKGYAWGYVADGESGNGQTSPITLSKPTPVSMPAGVTFTQIATGAFHDLAIGSDGKTYAWGSNYNGALGVQPSGVDQSTPAPIDTPVGVTFTQISAGYGHSSAIASDGHLYVWGGQLGNAAPRSQTPVLVDTAPHVTEVLFGPLAGTVTNDGSPWSATTPAQCGVKDVTVNYTQFGVTHQIVTPNGFTYGTAPAITSQPSSATTAIGDTFTTQVSATGDDTPTIQWQQAATSAGPWTDIAGETTTTLSVTVEGNAAYRAIITNCVGQVISDAAVASIPTPRPTATPTSNPSPSVSATSSAAAPTNSATASNPASPIQSPVPTNTMASDATKNPKDLAYTGVEATLPIFIAIVLLALGILIAVFTRRNRERSRHTH